MADSGTTLASFVVRSPGDPTECLRVLSRHGYDFNRHDRNGLDLLSTAISQKKPSALVKALLNEHQCSTRVHDSNGWTPLHYAAKYDEIESMKLLLDAGADAYARNGSHMKGRTPLHIASLNDSVDAIKLLLEYSVDIHIRDLENSTPLHTSVYFNKRDATLALVKHGSVLDLLDRWNRTPLMNACAGFAEDKSSTAGLKALISAGVPLTGRQPGSVSLLGIAAQNGRIEQLKVLWEATKWEHPEVEQAVYLAEQNHHKDVVAIMRCRDVTQA
jgi:ankyrin repeat protein